MKTPVLRRELKFLALSGVENVRMAGDTVIGQFKPTLSEIAGTRNDSLIQRFVNWPDDAKSIVRFTRRYGPLEVSPVIGGSFEFHLSAFKSAQEHFRGMWRHPRNHSNLELLNQGGVLKYRGRSLTYTAPTLYAFLHADLTTSPVERVRVCKRKECPHPYFIAGHLKQRFCSDDCAEEGQRVLKREWWERHGQSWRSKRRTKTAEGVESGSKEAR
jgi:hypothetical protein